MAIATPTQTSPYSPPTLGLQTSVPIKNAEALESDFFQFSIPGYSRVLHHKCLQVINDCLGHLGPRPQPFSPSAFVDHCIPHYILFMGLLLRSPKYEGNYPEPDTIEQVAYWQLQMRETVVDRFKRGMSMPCDYQLYHCNHLAAKYEDKKFTVLDSRLLSKCIHDFGFDDTLTPEMISEAIDCGMIPADKEAALRKWEYYSFKRALRKSHYRGHSNKAHAIFDEEVRSLGDARAEEICHMAKNHILNNEENLFFKMEDFRPKRISFFFPVPHIEKIYDYLSGRVALKDLRITPEKAYDTLTALKMIDWARTWVNLMSVNAHAFQPNADLKLRVHLLSMLPTATSHIVFARTMHPAKMQDGRCWANPNHWISEWAAQRAMAAVIKKIESDSLARRMRLSIGARACIGLRGNTAAGKSTLAKALLKKLGLDCSEEARHGTMDPDSVKWLLKKEQGRTTAAMLNRQIHREGAALFDHIQAEVRRHPTKPFILDQRLLTKQEIEEKLLIPAETKRLPAILYDIEAPSLTCSLLRVLARPAYGEAPCPPADAIIEGYVASIGNRQEIIETVVKTRSVVQEYRLFKDGKLAAFLARTSQVQHAELTITDPKLYAESLSPTDQESISAEADQVISKDLIDDAIERGFIAKAQSDALSCWLGFSLRLAVETHSKGAVEQSGQTISHATFTVDDSIRHLIPSKTPQTTPGKGYLRG